MSEPNFAEDFFPMQNADVSLTGLNSGDGNGNVANFSEGPPPTGVKTH